MDKGLYLSVSRGVNKLANRNKRVKKVTGHSFRKSGACINETKYGDKPEMKDDVKRLCTNQDSDAMYKRYTHHGRLQKDSAARIERRLETANLRHRMGDLVLMPPQAPPKPPTPTSTSNVHMTQPQEPNIMAPQPVHLQSFRAEMEPSLSFTTTRFDCNNNPTNTYRSWPMVMNPMMHPMMHRQHSHARGRQSNPVFPHVHPDIHQRGQTAAKKRYPELFYDDGIQGNAHGQCHGQSYPQLLNTVQVGVDKMNLGGGGAQGFTVHNQGGNGQSFNMRKQRGGGSQGFSEQNLGVDAQGFNVRKQRGGGSQGFTVHSQGVGGHGSNVHNQGGNGQGPVYHIPVYHYGGGQEPVSLPPALNMNYGGGRAAKSVQGTGIPVLNQGMNSGGARQIHPQQHKQGNLGYSAQRGTNYNNAQQKSFPY